MAQSLSQIYIHLIFHVKTTSVAIQEYDLDNLFAYIAGILDNIGCHALAVGGMRDHVHIIFRLGTQTNVAGLVERVKISTNKYIRGLAPMYRGFSWQAGYGAFSVSPGSIDAACEYVRGQKMHHRDKDFSKEYIMFLKGNGVNYDERHVLSD